MSIDITLTSLTPLTNYDGSEDIISMSQLPNLDRVIWGVVRHVGKVKHLISNQYLHQQL